MKAILLTALAAGAMLLTGCETTAVVESHPYHGGYGGTHVYYTSGRPYYYTGGVRYWGYPRGYSTGYHGHGYHNYDSHPRYSYSRNVEVERNTYVVNNNRTVYRNQNYPAQYRSGTYNHGSNVKVKTYPHGEVKTYPQGQVKKKKKTHNPA